MAVGSKRVLFFSPYAHIKQHSFSEVILAQGLAKAGHKITLMCCDGTLINDCLSRFVSANAGTRPEDVKSTLCRDCKRARRTMLENTCVNSVFVDDYVNYEKSTIGLTQEIPFPAILDYQSNGIELGRLAGYEILINHKKYDNNFTFEEERDYRLVFNAMVTHLRAFQNALIQLKPDIVFIYNSLYSINQVFSRLASLAGATVYSEFTGLSQYNTYDSLILAKSSSYHFFEQLKKHVWPHRTSEKLTVRGLDYVNNHFSRLMQGRGLHAFSVARTGTSSKIRKMFSLHADVKILVATMSSYDERFAANFCGYIDDGKDLLFKDQLCWIKGLIQWVENRNDLALIIRVHPREFPNRGKARNAPHVAMLRKELAALPGNCHVNWPEHNLSIYDFAECTDVFLNAWSSAGSEMSLLGKQVVKYSDNLTIYPSDLHLTGISLTTYFQAIEKALQLGDSFENTVNGYYWYYSLLFNHKISLLNTRLASLFLVPFLSLGVHLLEMRWIRRPLFKFVRVIASERTAQHIEGLFDFSKKSKRLEDFLFDINLLARKISKQDMEKVLLLIDQKEELLVGHHQGKRKYHSSWNRHQIQAAFFRLMRIQQ